MSLLGPRGFAELGRADPAAEPLRGASLLDEIPGVRVRCARTGSSRSSSCTFDGTGKTVAEMNRAAPRARHLRRQGPLARLPAARTERALLRHRGAHAGRHRPPRRRARGGDWHDQPAPLPRRRLGRAARDGDGRRRAAAASSSRGRGRGARRRRRCAALVPAAMRRAAPPDAARALGARGAAPLPASLAGDARDDGHQPVRHVHDEVQPAARRGARGAAGDRRAPPVPGRRHAPGRARDRPRPRPDPARALGHGRGSSSRPAAARTPRTRIACVDARLPRRRAASSSSATR